jgi:hypothetical protein
MGKKFVLKGPYQRYTDEEFLDDLRRVATIAGKNTVTKSDYQKHGKYNRRTISDRF